MDPLNPENKKEADVSPIENAELSIMPEGKKEEIPENSTIQNPIPPTSPQIAPQEVPKMEPPKPKESFELKPKKLITKSVQDVKKEKSVLQESVTKEEEKPEDVMSTEPRSFASAIVKTVFILLIGVGVFALTLLLQRLLSAQTEAIFDDRYLVLIPSGQSIEMVIEDDVFSVKDEYEIQGGELLRTQAVSGVLLNLPYKGVLRLDVETEVLVEEFDKEDNQYSLTLNKGNLWGNLLNNFFELRVKSGEIIVIPSLSLFNIENDETRTNIYALKHDVLVDIMADDKVINKLWIAEGNQAQFANIKIVQQAETIEQLLYSKLVKEFNYGRSSNSKMEENVWVTNNLEEDKKFKLSIEENFERIIKDSGLANLSADSLRYQTQEMISDLRKALTFSDFKKASGLIKGIFENVNDAAFLYMQGNNVDADVRLALFKEDINDSSIVGDEKAEEFLNDEIRAKLSDYVSFSPKHELYPIKELLFDEVFAEDPNFILLTLKLNDAYDALDEEIKEADKLLVDYFKFYEKLVRRYRIKGIDEIGDELLKQNILLDNLLYLYPEIYKLNIFTSKRKVEDDYLSSMKGARDKKEQKQTYISEKINLLNKIEEFLFAELLDPVDARQIVSQLITDMEEYQKDTLDAAAINDLFEKRLSDFGIFWEYIKSDEYATTPLHGDTHLERFAVFNAIQQRNVTFEDIRLEILGAQVVEDELTVEQILENVENILEEAGIENVEFGFYNDVDDTKVPIVSAYVSGIELSATYDWNRDIMSGIVVGDEILSEEGLKLNKTKSFIVDYIASKSRPTPVFEEPEDDEITNEDEIIKAAKVFIADKFNKEGLSIDYELIQIVSLNEGIYRVEDVFFKSLKSAKFSFDYLNQEDKVTNVIIPTKSGKVRTIKDTFSITFLDDVVTKIYEEE